MTHALQTSQGELIAELEAAGAVVTGSKVRCPFHNDQNPSAGIFEGKDGVWRFKCHSCDAKGDVFDIKARRTGRPVAELLREHGQDTPRQTKAPAPDRKHTPMTFDDLQAVYGWLEHKHGGHLEACHEYLNADGTYNQFVIRWRISPTKKTIRPVVKTEAGYLLESPKQRVLYKLPALAGKKTVAIVEGESKVDLLAEYGFPVTTSAGGCKAAHLTDWKPLAGRQIIIWPDHDLPGKGYADDVRRILEGMGCQVKTVDPATLDLGEGEDVVDYVRQLRNAGFNELRIKENLTQVFSKAKSTGPGQEVVHAISAIGSGQYEPIETGFRWLDETMQILPGSLNLVCGSPGSSKSLMMLQLAAQWHMQGVKTAVFELEKDRCFHLRRALAQQSGLANLTNNRWVKLNSEIARQTAVDYADWMDGFGRTIYAMPEKIIFQQDVVNWTQARADAGCRAVIIDPVTKAERRGETWKADGEFVSQLAQIATMTRIAIFLVLHPAKSLIAMPDLSQIAGGSAYSRFADNAVWLEHHEPKTSTIRFCTGLAEGSHDRTMWILKSRDGSGTGTRIAFQFDNQNLTLRELGQIERKKGKQ